jgi:REP element-mobilizing transposase RayT
MRFNLTVRGNERRVIFRYDRNGQHYLEVLAELPERFGTRRHGCVLLDNHFHLVLEPPKLNLIQAGQWSNCQK